MLRINDIYFPAIDDDEVRYTSLPMLMIAVNGCPYRSEANGSPENPLPPAEVTKVPYDSANQRIIDSLKDESSGRKLLFSVRNRGGNTLHLILQSPRPGNEGIYFYYETFHMANNDRLSWDEICDCCGARYLHVADTSKSMISQLPLYNLGEIYPILVTNHLTEDDVILIMGSNRHAKVYKFQNVYIVKYMSILNSVSRADCGLEKFAGTGISKLKWDTTYEEMVKYYKKHKPARRIIEVTV